MKKTLLGAALLTVLAGSCTNENIEALEQNSRMVCIEASYGLASRTAIDGSQTVWQEGDQIFVSSHDGKCFGTLTLVDGEDTPDGKFKGFVSGKPSDLAYSVFPVPNKEGIIDLTKRDANKPNAPMIATFENLNSLAFDLTCGMVAIKINGAKGENVTLTYDGFGLGGTAVVDYNETTQKYELVYTRTTTAENGVTITGIPSNEALVYIPVITSDASGNKLPAIGNININVTIEEASAVINVPVVEGNVSLKQVPEITYDGTKITKEDTVTPNPEVGLTVEEALRQALVSDDDKVITLSENIELTSPLVVSGAKVLDLAGFQITNGNEFADSDDERALVIVNRNATLTVNNSMPNGGIVVTNNNAIYTAIKMTGSDEAENGPVAALVVNGGHIGGTYYGISGNGTRHETSVIINGGTIYCTGQGSGIFQPQNGSLEINGGEISGYESAVEVRAGSMVMNGGTLKCETNFNAPVKNGDGTTMRGGVALGVARHTTGKDVSVDINGGELTVTGTDAYGVYEFSQDDAAGKAEIHLKDASYPVKAESATLNCEVSDRDYLEKAVEFDAKKIEVTLIEDIEGDVTVVQNPGVKISIDGQKHNYNGLILVNGQSGTYITAALSIKNVNFNAGSISSDACIRLGDGTNDTRYTCNVAVEGCTFDVPGAVGVKSYTGGDKNLTVTGCTATEKTHSMIQAKGIDGILVENCFVYSKNGLNFNNSTNVTVNYCTTDVKGYAVRFGESSGGAGTAETYFIKNSTLKAACNDGDAVVVLRGTADYSTLNIENTKLEGTIQITNNAKEANVIIDGTYYVGDADALARVVAAGATKLYLMPGEYNVHDCGGKTLTINGTKEAILKLMNEGEDGCDYGFGGNGTGVGNYTFNGITINTTANTGNYKGYAYMKGTFNNCTFVGSYSLNNANDFVFNDCTFELKGYLWTWGANSATFNGCTFTGDSRSILAHGSAPTVITINNCKFNATEVGKTGTGDPTAAVEIDPVSTNTYTIKFEGNNTKTEFYAGWTRIKDGSTGHTITGLN